MTGDAAAAAAIALLPWAIAELRRWERRRMRRAGRLRTRRRDLERAHLVDVYESKADRPTNGNGD